MLKVLAYTPEDGWAYVRADNHISLVRPPYVAGQKALVRPETVDRAITAHGFVTSSREFADWASLVAFLDQEVDHWRNKNAPMTEEQVGEAVLQMAPRDVVVRFLERIEKELLVQARWDHARRILRGLLTSPVVRENSDLHERVLSLSEAAISGAERAASSRDRLVVEGALDEEFALAYRRYSQDSINGCAEQIAEDQCVFALAR